LKKAGKLAAKRLGTNRRGKRKIELIQNIYRALRKR
jgi:large subunit ribosomal protein L36e